jgi:hypothetical protein
MRFLLPIRRNFCANTLKVSDDALQTKLWKAYAEKKGLPVA